MGNDDQVVKACLTEGAAWCGEVQHQVSSGPEVVQFIQGGSRQRLQSGRAHPGKAWCHVSGQPRTGTSIPHAQTTPHTFACSLPPCFSPSLHIGQHTHRSPLTLSQELQVVTFILLPSLISGFWGGGLVEINQGLYISKNHNVFVFQINRKIPPTCLLLYEAKKKKNTVKYIKRT